MTAAGVSDFERMAALHWQAVEQAALGDWVLRASSGFTGRANSALPLGDPGMPLAEAVDTVEEWYRARGLPPMIQLPMRLDGGAGDCPLGELLARRGWRVRPGPAVVMTARSAAVARYLDEDGIVLTPEPDGQWLARYRYRGAELPPAARSLLLSAPDQMFASTRRGGETVAIGRLSLAGGWGGLTAIEVAPSWRRTGLGTAVTAALAAEADRRGATRIFLQVEERNGGARALYRRCGFRDRHRYHYRIASDSR